MTEPDLDAIRALAVAVAYRMVGSRTEAEDLAQEAVLRVAAAASAAATGSAERLRSPEAYVTTVTTRLAIDHLRRARVRREAYLGPWLPEPVVDEPFVDPGRAAELAESLSYALLVVLEALTPLERAAFLLHDVFGYDYASVGEVLGRAEPACRQLVARARRHLAAGSARRAVDRAEHARLVERFTDAARDGDMDGLLALLAPEAVLVSDGGPRRRAARHPIVGADRVARFLRVVGPSIAAEGTFEPATVNGAPGLVVRRPDGELHLAGTVEVADGRIVAVRWVLNPDKLRWLTSGAGAGAGAGVEVDAGTRPRSR